MGWTVYNSSGQILQGSSTLADESVDSDHYVDGSIDNIHLADNAVDTEEIANDAVTFAKLATSSITGAPDLGEAPATGDSLLISDTSASAALKEITVANLFSAPAITGDATATTQAGTDDSTKIATTAHVKDVKIDDFTAGDDNTTLDSSTSRHGLLRKLGGGTTNYLRADGSWATPSPGGKLELIDTAPASGSSGTLDVTGLDSTTYDTYLIEIANLVPGTNDQVLYLRMGDGGYDDGVSDYKWHQQTSSVGNSSYGAANDSADSKIQIAGDATNGGVGSAAGKGCGAVLWLHRPGDGTMEPMITGTYMLKTAGGGHVGGAIFGVRTSVIDVDRIRIYFASGTVAAGRLTVWGLGH